MKIQRASFDRFFEYTVCALLVLLVVGIPLVFTAYTRSVFEINKMLVLRYVTLLVCGLWVVRTWLYNAFSVNNTETDKPVYRFFGLTWQKIGLEPWILVWVVMTVLSTIFSQNPKLSVIGAYDRWEGIFTVLNYVFLLLMTAKLVTSRKALVWILGAALLAAGGSAVYGVFQSLEMDFMKWSVDPAQRVFACINNPVHFCAYMGMMVPIGLSFLMFLSSRENSRPWLSWMKVGVFVVLGLVFYSQLLSFSRATWIGFMGAMPLYYLLVTEQFDKGSIRRFSADFFVTAIAMALFYIAYVFQFHQKSLWVAIPLFGLLGLCVVYFWRSAYRALSETGVFRWGNLFQGLFLMAVLLAVFFARPFGSEWVNMLWVLLVSGVFLWQAINLQGAQRRFIGRLVLILIFSLLQFVGGSFVSALTYTVLVYALYLLVIRDVPIFNSEKRFWMWGTLALFGLIVFIPSVPALVPRLFSGDARNIDAIKHAQVKMTTYSVDAIKGSARTSMWKSSFPWIKDHWLLGSGLDTIKYMYPDYRRPEYGILEGGHNFTPDRLHNEYLNTFATRGIFATLVYYLGIVLGWYVLVIAGYFRLAQSPYRYFLAGCIAGCTVYLGQVMFNFGVVATLTLFYVLMGLGWAIVLHRDFYQESQS